MQNISVNKSSESQEIGIARFKKGLFSKMHEIFRSLLSCRTKRAVENALLLRRSRELSTHPFILPWHESFFSACIANLHIDWLQPCGISGLVDTYSVIFFRTRIFQFFLRFQKCSYAKTQCRHRIRAKSFLFLSVHTKTLTIWPLCFQKSLLQGPFSEICFFCTRNHRLRVDRRLKRRKKIFLFKNIPEPF